VSQSQSSSDSCSLDFQDCSQSCQNIHDDNKHNVAVQQPSSTSSLAVAQRFFQELDADHPLTLADLSPSNLRGSVRHKLLDGRTCRVLTLNDPRIKKDYQAYSAMCKDARVDPLPLNEFLAQCSMTRNYVYDGFLDE
jgi:hypothetical protein